MIYVTKKNGEYTTLRYATLHYTNYTTQQLQLQLQMQLHYTNYTTLQLQLRYTTTQLQLQLRYTTLHPAVVGEVAIATIAATSKKKNTPTTFRSISGFALPFVIHSNQPLL